MSKPTSGEIEWIKLQALTWLDKYDADVLVNLCNAYLAQEEELEAEKKKVAHLNWLLTFSKKTNNTIIDHAEKLEAENQELKAKLDYRDTRTLYDGDNLP